MRRFFLRLEEALPPLDRSGSEPSDRGVCDAAETNATAGDTDRVSVSSMYEELALCFNSHSLGKEVSVKKQTQPHILPALRSAATLPAVAWAKFAINPKNVAAASQKDWDKIDTSDALAAIKSCDRVTSMATELADNGITPLPCSHWEGTELYITAKTREREVSIAKVAAATQLTPPTNFSHTVAN